MAYDLEDGDGGGDRTTNLNTRSCWSRKNKCEWSCPPPRPPVLCLAQSFQTVLAPRPVLRCLLCPRASRIKGRWCTHLHIILWINKGVGKWWAGSVTSCDPSRGRTRWCESWRGAALMARLSNVLWHLSAVGGNTRGRELLVQKGEPLLNVLSCASWVAVACHGDEMRGESVEFTWNFWVRAPASPSRNAGDRRAKVNILLHASVWTNDPTDIWSKTLSLTVGDGLWELNGKLDWDFFVWDF